MDTIQSKFAQVPRTRGASTALAGVLRTEILEGRLRPGDRLPTLRRVCEMSNLGYSVVNRAISILVEEGLVHARKGAGTFVTEPATAMVSAQGTPSKIFALVIPETEAGIFAAVQHGFCEAAAELQYQVLVCSTGESMVKQSDVLMQLIDRSVTGIAIAPTGQIPHGQPHQLNVVQKAGIPIVQLNRRIEGGRAPSILLSFKDLGAMAARVLVSSGHTAVMMVGSHQGEVATEYESGFRGMYKKLGLTPSLEQCYSSYPNDGWQEELRALVDEFLSRREKPTAFFALFDDVAELIYLRATALRYEMPRDFSLISFGGSQRSGVLGGLISTVTGDEIWAGRKAVALLAEIAGGKRDKYSTEVFEIPLKFYEGETLGRLMGANSSADAERAIQRSTVSTH